MRYSVAIKSHENVYIFHSVLVYKVETDILSRGQCIIKGFCFYIEMVRRMRAGIKNDFYKHAPAPARRCPFYTGSSGVDGQYLSCRP